MVVDKSALARAGLAYILRGSRFRITASCSRLSCLPESALRDASVLVIGVDDDATSILSQVTSVTERGIKVVIQCARLRLSELAAAMNAGAVGYLLKDEIGPEVLLKSLEFVLEGGVVILREHRRSRGGATRTAQRGHLVE